MGKMRNLKSTSVVSSRTAAESSMPSTNQESLRKLIQFDEDLCGGDRDDDDGDRDDDDGDGDDGDGDTVQLMVSKLTCDKEGEERREKKRPYSRLAFTDLCFSQTRFLHLQLTFGGKRICFF